MIKNHEPPIPRHLKEILVSEGDANNELEVTGEITCTCNSKNFEIAFVGDDSDYRSERVIRLVAVNGGYYLVVKVRCLGCDREHLIFDKSLHGWNGWVCTEDEEKGLPRPTGKTFHCHKCESAAHSLKVTIGSQGKADFISETEGDFPAEDWAEGFSWITIATECNSCNYKNKDWISYETM